MGGIVPTWADVIAIGAAVMSGAYTFGVMGQKVRTLEEKADRAEDLERDFHELTDRLIRLEVGMANVQTLLTEVRDTIRRSSRP
jgi:signal recognition particle GTPase